MGLVGLLVAILLVILLLVFGRSTLSPFNYTSADDPKNIRNRTQDAVDSTNEHLKQQQDQIKNIEVP